MVYTPNVIRDTLHEDFRRGQESYISSDRALAIVFAVLFALVGFSPLSPDRLVAFPVAGLFPFAGALKTGLAASLE